MRVVIWAIVSLSAGVLRAGVAGAAEPNFEFGKAEEVKETAWKAVAQGGLVITSGNSSATAGSAGLNVARDDGRNKVALDLGGGQRPPIGQGADRGGQVGYSRSLWRSERHSFVVELGYDFSFEKYVDVADGVAIHSARLFAGAENKVGEATVLVLGLEALENLNTEDTVYGPVDPMVDLRINGRGSITTKILDNISLRFGVTVRYDRDPAPRPKLKLPFAMGFLPRAETTDILTEAAVVVTLF